MIGIFIGDNGSMGFEHGKMYRFATSIEDGYLQITAKNGLYCYYQNLETLLDNWRIVSEGTSLRKDKGNWTDF